VFIEEIAEEPVIAQNNLFVEPAPATADVNNIAMTGNYYYYIYVSTSLLEQIERWHCQLVVVNHSRCR